MAKKRLFVVMIGLCLIVMPAMFLVTPAFAQGKVIELTVNDHNPEVTAPAQALKYWAQEVEKLCGGRVKMNIVYGGALLKGSEAYRGTQKGVADVAHYVIDRRDGFFLNTVMSLPFMGWPGQKETGMMYQDLLKRIPALTEEWKGVKIIGLMMMPPSHLHMTKKVIKTPDDLKGVKIFAPEAAVSESIAAMGGTPVHIDIADMYMSLDRGLVDGILSHFPVVFVFGSLELVKNHTIFGDGGVSKIPMYVIMNAEKFDSLPPDIQEIIGNSGQIWTDKFYELDFGLQTKCVNDAKGWNHSFTYLTPEEIKAYYDLVKGPVHEKWIKDAEAKGLPGKAVYEEALKLLQ